MQLISGTELADKVKHDLSERIKLLKRKPNLVVIIVGDDPASKVYVKNKEKAAEKCGIKSLTIRMPEATSESELLNKINELNHDEHIDGILVQLPLPKQIDEKKVILAISPLKDVDCFHPINVGNLYSGNITINSMLPCTPKGIVRLIKEVEPNLGGKKVCIVGRSNIVGKPVAQLLLNESCTVKITHSKTANLEDETKWSDILIVAIGRPKFITAEYVNENMLVIDVGVNRTETGICGDTDFDNIKNIVKAITPVPGGCGPMTIACLMENVYNCAIN
ncbi:MAG: bifunctional methylenetetrahydrofolate dehydrogenase/methenyltetrahydrofolate cyclohydrolase [Rickettsiales bacterium]|nr:bifunctional methylenetetrahydrofolate dehydrogenase/methenyltetrahydrofolate cyclohydrolase [Rickettsiales bacterium]